MASRAPHPSQNPRELRRSVVLPARLRAGAAWSDACILNISSRGLLIHAHRVAPQGTMVEVWRGEHMIVARVVWRDGAKAGLRAEERVPVEDIVTRAQSEGLQLTVGDPNERRRRARDSHDDSRLRGRAVEFFTVVAVAVSLAASGLIMLERALAKPLAAVTAVLGG